MGKLNDSLKKLGKGLTGNDIVANKLGAIIEETAEGVGDYIANKAYVNSLMSGALKRLIVEELPQEDIDTNTIYMVLDSQSEQEGNVYNEYMYIEDAWELIGTTAVSGGATFYRHDISFRAVGMSNAVVYSFVNASSKNDYTFSEIEAILRTKNYISDKSSISTSAISTAGADTQLVTNIENFKGVGDKIKYYYARVQQIGSNAITLSINEYEFESIYDQTVTEL